MPGRIRFGGDQHDPGIAQNLLPLAIGGTEHHHPGRHPTRLGDQPRARRDTQMAIDDDPHRRAVRQPGQPAGQLRVIGQHGRGADQDRVMRGAQEMGALARQRTGDPAAFAGGGGDASVERGGELQRHQRPAEPHALQKAGIVNFDAEISADGQTLWFDDGDYSTGSLTAASIVSADRQGATFVRNPNSASILAAVNNSDLNYAPSISVDSLELFFTRASTASGATPAIYRTTRTDKNSAFAAPELVTAASGFVEAPSLSADGHLLYFHKLLNGIFVIQYVRR